MYRLLSPTQLLHKAGKQGLIAIQKQVTKKGKTFTQTFYVKPESVPKDLHRPKRVKVPGREVIVATDDWTVGDPKQRVTSKEVDEVARNLWMNYIQADYDMGKINDSTKVSNIKKWLEEVENVEYNTDLQDILKHTMDSTTLVHAIDLQLTYDDAFNSWYAIDKALMELQNAGKPSYRQLVTDWARKHENDFVDGYDPHMYGVSDKYGDEKWTPADVLKYAIDNDMDLQDAQQEAEQDVNEKSDDEESFEDINVVDAYGKEWEYGDIRSISSWVGGVVQTTRNKMKMNDESRRKGIDIKGLQGSTSADHIIEAVEQHMAPYTAKPRLYRGTTNPAWLEAEVGQTIQLGLASFSKIDTKAHYFSDGLTVLVMDTTDMTNQVVGVDIDNLINTIRDAGYSEGLSRNTSFDAYDDEKEFLVRSPSIEITKIEKNVNLGKQEGTTRFEVERFIHIKPTEMSMVQFMKALFEDNVLAMERTFDFNLHREPEDEWNW